MKKKWMITSVATAATAITAAAAWNTTSNALGGRRQTYEEALKWQGEHYDISWFEDLDKEEYTVCSDGYILHALFCENPQPTDRCVILTHGYTDNRYGNLKYMKLYLDLGFHCITYDLRGHGANERAYCTYSLREGEDLLNVLYDAKMRFPDITTYGFHGESLGSSTVITALGGHPDIAFAVADCGFADIENVLKGVLRRMHVPTTLLYLSSYFAKLRCGYTFSEMRPIDRLPHNKIPILFIHGQNDTFITPDNSQRMQQCTGGYSELRLIPDAKHANSVIKQPKLYREYVSSFLDTIGMLH